VEREWVFPSSDCGRSILDFQLAADIFQVLAHGSLGDAQHMTDSVVGPAPRYQREDFCFTPGQTVALRRRIL